MSDNYGSGQNRVLEVQDRSFDSVVFQHRKPPLSSEWNLINQISNQKTQDQLKVQIPSGFVAVEDILQDLPEEYSLAGQILTSESYLENSFKLMSKGKNVVVVNGWPLLLEGINTSTEDNVITLNEPGTQEYDFVFLEVWRKLLGSTDPLYPHGNTHKAPYGDNEIEWDAVGAETSKRVQIQYRVRVQSIDSDLNTHSVGFNDVTVRPIGGRTNTDASLQYISAGSRDIGLWVAGDGSENSKNSLKTVDGFVYAVPMFMVNRRKPSDFSNSNVRGTSVSKQDILNGKVSDRPDGRLLDSIYREDIIDLRHKVITHGEDLNSIMNRSIRRLIKGELNTSINKAYGTNGSRVISASGGSILTKLEQLNKTGSGEAPNMGNGSGVNGTNFKKRSFLNSNSELGNNLIEIPINGTGVGSWSEGSFLIDTSSYPEGEIVSIDAHYSKDADVTGVTFSFVGATTDVEVTVDDSSNLIGTSYKLYAVFTYKTYASNYGTKDIPSSYIEVNKGGGVIIAPKSKDVPIRYNNTGELLDFSISGNSGESDVRDYFHNAGAGYDSNYDFGHELVIYRNASSLSLNIGLSNGKLNGHYILGVKTVQEVVGGIAGDPINFGVSRSVTASPFSVDSYTVTVGAPAELKITLYTGSKPQEAFGEVIEPGNTVKYFEESKHGRGIVDTFETIEVYAGETTSGTYTLDTRDKVIIAFGTKTRAVLGNVVGTLFAFDPSGQLVTSLSINSSNDVNSMLPVETPLLGFLPTRISFEATPGLGYLKLPVIVHSYVETNEIPYDVYFKCSPYQGLLRSTDSLKGKVISRGKAIITSLGSGTLLAEGTPVSNVIGRLPTYDIEDYKYNSDNMEFAGFTGPLRELDVSFPVQDFLDTIPNDFILGSSSKSGSRGRFNLTLGSENQRVIMEYGNLDVALSDGGLKKVCQFYLMRASNSPIAGDGDVTGRVYLVAVTSESGNDSLGNKIEGSTNKDSIDIFELCGRPIIK